MLRYRPALPSTPSKTFIGLRHMGINWEGRGVHTSGKSLHIFATASRTSSCVGVKEEGSLREVNVLLLELMIPSALGLCSWDCHDRCGGVVPVHRTALYIRVRERTEWVQLRANISIQCLLVTKLLSCNNCTCISVILDGWGVGCALVYRGKTAICRRTTQMGNFQRLPGEDDNLYRPQT